MRLGPSAHVYKIKDKGDGSTFSNDIHQIDAGYIINGSSIVLSRRLYECPVLVDSKTW